MDMEDGDFDGNLSELTERKPENIAAPPEREDAPDGIYQLLAFPTSNSGDFFISLFVCLPWWNCLNSLCF